MKASILGRLIDPRAGFVAAVLLGASLAYGAAPVVKTIPWVAGNALIPHDTWSAKTIHLKGTCDVQGAGFEYFWDFGDGSPTATGTVTDRFAVESSHAYVGAVGTVFTARLTVRNQGTGESDTEVYLVQIQDQTLPVEVNVAIDEGLWYLFKIAYRGTPGRWQWDNDNKGGYNYSANPTASAVQAFEVNGFLESQDNPYAEAVRGGIAYILASLKSYPMALQLGLDPDSNHNGIGLAVNSTRSIYETGAVMDALVASGTPGAVSSVGVDEVVGRTYQEIVQDMVDMYCWGQDDAGGDFGGWRYSWNSDSDNSAAQWGAIGMIAAERHFGCVVPPWVKTQNDTWLANSYNATGYFGYDGTGSGHPLSTGPCGMVQLAFCGFTSSDPRWVKCDEYLADQWSTFINNSREARYYSYYAFAKAMRTAQPNPVIHLAKNGLDWYGDGTSGLARILVSRQNASGYWPYDGWPYVGEQPAAAWNVIILSRTLFQSGLPVAVAQATPNPAVAGQIIQLDGAGSFHQDASRSIDSWEWDLDNDGTFDVSGPFATVSFPAIGSYPVRLRVTDDGAPELSADTTVTILIDTPPLPPTANAGGPYRFCPQSKPWFLDGTGSTNPDDGESEPGFPGDYIKRYEWDLNGDNAFDEASGAIPDVTAYFDARGPGSYLIGLKVTDNTSQSFPVLQLPDLTDTDTAEVRVYEPTNPECVCVSDLMGRGKGVRGFLVIQLVWSPTSKAGVDHYNVYRGTLPGGPYLKLGESTSTYAVYTDVGGLAFNTDYHYVVREATLAGHELCQSNEAKVRVRSPR